MRIACCIILLFREVKGNGFSLLYVIGEPIKNLSTLCIVNESIHSCVSVVNFQSAYISIIMHIYCYRNYISHRFKTILKVWLSISAHMRKIFCSDNKTFLSMNYHFFVVVYLQTYIIIKKFYIFIIFQICVNFHIFQSKFYFT